MMADRHVIDGEVDDFSGRVRASFLFFRRRASAATCSDTSSIVTSSPSAFCRNQRRLGSAAVHRKVCSSSLDTVPSSMTMPAYGGRQSTLVQQL